MEHLTRIETPYGQYDIAFPNGTLDAYRESIAQSGGVDHIHAALFALTKEGDAILDLGANIGAVSIPLALAGRKLIAYEPLAENADIIKRSIELNGLGDRLSVRQMGVWNKSGKLKFVGFSAWGSVGNNPAIDGATEEVDCVAMDDVADLPKITAIKMDIEGSETHALEGMQRLIDQQTPHVLFESNCIALSHQGMCTAELLEFFTKRGFFLYRLLPGMRAAPISSIPQEVVFCDYLATKMAPDDLGGSGFDVSPYSDDEIAESIEQQSLHGDIHRVYVASVSHLFPERIRNHPRVKPLIDQWNDHFHDHAGRPYCLSGLVRS